MGLYGGNDTENVYVSSDVSDIPLSLAFHSEDFLKKSITEYFGIISFEKINIDDKKDFDVFYSSVLRKL